MKTSCHKDGKPAIGLGIMVTVDGITLIIFNLSFSINWACPRIETVKNHVR